MRRIINEVRNAAIVRRMINEARQDALEEAARVADQYIDDPVNNAHAIAATIRVLKGEK